MKYILTNAGMEIKANMEAGANLHFTKVETGETYSRIPEELKSVPNAKQTLGIEDITVKDNNTAVVEIILSNIEVTEKYYIKQMGLYAINPATNEEVLYIIGQDDRGEEVPAITDKEVQYMYYINIKAGNAASVTFSVSGEDFVRKKTFLEHINNTNNPHKVTKEQVGLSDVTNISLAEIFKRIYPVGAIYMSTSQVNPGTLFGGTWVSWGNGRVPVGVNTADGDFNTPEKTGGAKTVSLSVSHMPPHFHSFTWNGKPTGSASTSVSIGAEGNHFHTAGALMTNLTSITGTLGNMMTDNSDGLIANGVFSRTNSDSHGRYGGGTVLSSLKDIGKIDATHGHTITGNTEWAGYHAHSANAYTNIDINNITVSGNTSSSGSGAAVNNMQPYITCYMWKRTA